MANDFTLLNSGTGGDNMDEEGITYTSAPTTRKRARVVVTGTTLASVADVVNTTLAGTEYGLITRTTATGNTASGSTAAGNPVQVGGKDTSNNAQVARMDTLSPSSVLVSLNTQLDETNDKIRAVTEGYKTTYSAAIIALVAATSATDIFTITGSATKTVRVLRIGLGATQTTAGVQGILLLKRSTANTGGTSTNPTAVSHDSNDAAATATITAYTANPTTGTLVGNVRSIKLGIPTATSVSDYQGVIWDFADHNGKAVVLRGIAEVLSIGCNAATITGNTFNISIEWTEE